MSPATPAREGMFEDLVLEWPGWVSVGHGAGEGQQGTEEAAAGGDFRNPSGQVPLLYGYCQL